MSISVHSAVQSRRYKVSLSVCLCTLYLSTCQLIICRLSMNSIVTLSSVSRYVFRDKASEKRYVSIAHQQQTSSLLQQGWIECRYPDTDHRVSHLIEWNSSTPIAYLDRDIRPAPRNHHFHRGEFIFVNAMEMHSGA